MPIARRCRGMRRQAQLEEGNSDHHAATKRARLGNRHGEVGFSSPRFPAARFEECRFLLDSE